MVSAPLQAREVFEVIFFKAREAMPETTINFKIMQTTLKMKIGERIEKSPHSFWLTTCGLNTYRRGPNYARQDTPWNAFTAARDAVVNSLWVDRIISIDDDQEQRTRRFVRLGARSRTWSGLAVAHGREARANLEAAISERRRVFGFEVEPNGAAMERGERVIKHFYMDRVHQLRPVYGLLGEDLKDRLNIDAAFRRKIPDSDNDVADPGFLFELVELSVPPPGAVATVSDAGVSPVPPPDHEESEDGEFDEVQEKVTLDEYAARTLPLLVAHVLQQRDDVLVPITYVHLAELLGRRTRNGAPWARGLGKVLSRVTAIVEHVTAGWREAPPHLTTVVVLSPGVANAGLPDDGISEQWPGYMSLSREDKQAKVLFEYQRILQFGNQWNDVLHEANLAPVAGLLDPCAPSQRGGWGGGESEAHKALKRFIVNNPQLCGAGSTWFSQEEYVLRSGDQIDVIFKSETEWIGVEVKSRISDGLLSDYERGLYQVVKYKAVLEAQARMDLPDCPPKVRVILALESQLPAIYVGDAKFLGVDYLEGLAPA